MKKIDKLVIVFFVIAFGALPFVASSVGYGGIGGRPANPDPENPRTSSWFIYNLEPGQQKQDAVEVINNTEEDLVILVYPHDSIKSSDGGFALKQFGNEKTKVGAPESGPRPPDQWPGSHCVHSGGRA